MQDRRTMRHRITAVPGNPAFRRCEHRGRTGLILATLISIVASAGVSAALPADQSLLEQRDHYEKAIAAVKVGDWRRVDRERAQLNDYPLAPYIDYERLKVRLSGTAGSVARDFASQEQHTPLGLRYLGYYLQRAGRDRRWDDFLAASPREPRSERLRCYYGRALRARGRLREAWALAEKLWVSGKSVDKACDPLFELWRAQGGINDSLVWERAGLAFSARQGSLLRYVASLGSKAIAADLVAMRNVYREPHRTLTHAGKASASARSQLLVLGLQRYSRYSPAGALKQASKLKDDALTAEQRRDVDMAIAYRGLLEREELLRGWLDRELPRWGDDKLTQMRLRWAIAESDWAAIDALTYALSDDLRDDSTWEYWHARALEDLGQPQQANVLFRRAAEERSYYGFLSADRLGLPYRYNSQATTPAIVDALSGAVEDFPGVDVDARSLSQGDAARELFAGLPSEAQAAVWRVHELQALNEQRAALSEWAYALRRLNHEQQLALAQIADAQDWYRLSIDAANASKNWDAIDLRFPLAYLDAFEERAMRQSLPVHQLMAIARRESAFAPSVRSSAGARGLMQLMPATGRAVAREVGMPLQLRQLYSVDTNLDLGSAYYRQLLDRFGGHRPIALAAYNAGPNRVQHWVGEQKPLDSWVETIPYRETRDYVKAVLAYSVVFAHRMGNAVPLLSEPERTARY